MRNSEPESKTITCFNVGLIILLCFHLVVIFSQVDFDDVNGRKCVKARMTDKWGDGLGIVWTKAALRE